MAMVQKVYNKAEIFCIITLKNRFIAVASGKYINIYDTDTGKRVKTLKGHDFQVWNLLYLKWNNILLSTSKNRIKIWDLRDFTCEKTILGPQTINTIFPYSENLLFLGNFLNNKILLYNLKEERIEKTIKNGFNGCMRGDKEIVVLGWIGKGGVQNSFQIRLYRICE
jgi:WD40 repeat protein